MKNYLDYLLTNGAVDAKIVKADTVETAAWTVFRCHYGCDFYGKSHCCPPKAPTWQQTKDMLASFEYGILFNAHNMNDIKPLALETSRRAFLDGNYKTIAFGAGPCTLCKVCNAEHCNFPKKTIPSMEACGIDVFATARNNGFEINTLRQKGETANYFGLVMIK